MANVVNDEHIQIERLELGPYGTNAYVLICRHTGESVVVDVPGEAAKIMELLKGTTPDIF